MFSTNRSPVMPWLAGCCRPWALGLSLSTLLTSSNTLYSSVVLFTGNHFTGYWLPLGHLFPPLGHQHFYRVLLDLRMGSVGVYGTPGGLRV